MHTLLLVAIHRLLIAIYLVAPILAVANAILRGRRGQLSAAGRFFVTTFIGTVLGTVLTVIYALALNGRAELSQIALSIYLVTAMLLILRTFDFLLRRGLRMVFASHLSAPGFFRTVILSVLRVAILFAIALPYVISAVMTYRPKVTVRDNTTNRPDISAIEFPATDGERISGWWIPTKTSSTKTVLIVHGMTTGRSNQIGRSQKLVPPGYNALVIDLRADGQSAGHLTSFGDLERRDVLGAVRWLRQIHPQQSTRIVGVGAGIGAAALIAAAADQSSEGQAIEAVAVYDTFDDLSLLAAAFARRSFLPPMDWLVAKIGLPFCSAQVGADLSDFKPARLVQQLWPRPILIIHGMGDTMIPFECGQRLYDAAFFPKAHLWLASDYNQVINDDDAAQAVREFFQTASAMPVI